MHLQNYFHIYLETNEVNSIASVNGLVPSNNKPLTDTILSAQFCDSIYHDTLMT